MISSESSPMSRMQVTSLGAEKQDPLFLKEKDFGFCSEVGVVWIPPEDFLLALYLGSKTHNCQQRNSEACLTFPEFFQVDLYWPICRSQNWWPVQGQILFSSSTGKRGVRKDVCVTQARTGSVQGAVCGPPEPRGGYLCSGAAPGRVCPSSLQAEPGWCLARLLLCIGQN